jgi:hypothetical protein
MALELPDDASSGVLGAVLCEWLEREGRGSATLLAKETCLTESDISNWLAKRRALPEWKLVDALQWLVSTGRISVTFHAEPQGPPTW